MLTQLRNFNMLYKRLWKVMRELIQVNKGYLKVRKIRIQLSASQVGILSVTPSVRIRVCAHVCVCVCVCVFT